jgi:hypothetical protein
MSTEPKIRFYGTVVNGVRMYYRSQLHNSRLKQLEGKVFEETLEIKYEEKTDDQRGYYFGGIIRATCMETEAFEGWTFDEIRNELEGRYLSYATTKTIKKLDGQEITTEVKGRDSIADLSKKKMSEFINNVLNFLATLEIYPLSPEEYLTGKYQSYVQTESNKQS